MRLLGEMMRGFRIGAARRLNVQPAQAEKPRRGIERHLLEGGLRLAEITFDLSRLRLQIMDERLIGQKLFRRLCGVLRRRRVAGGRSDNALGHGVDPLFAPAPLRALPQTFRHSDRAGEQRPDQDDGGERDQNRRRRDGNGGVDVMRAPVDRDRAGLIDHLLHPVGEGGEQQDEQQYEPHGRRFLAR